MPDSPKVSVARRTSVVGEDLTLTLTGLVVEPSSARAYDANQHSETWQHSIKSHPRALVWCLYSLFTCVMWGYDGLAGAIVISLPKFREDFGYEYNGAYVVSAEWQLGFTAASTVGLVIGGILTGLIIKHSGRQLAMAIAYAISVAGVFLQWYSNGSLPRFFGGKLLTAIPLGVFVTVAPTYCAEVAPLRLRGATTAAVNWSIVLGQLIGYGVMRQASQIDGPNQYRMMFAVQWGFAAVAIVILPFFPESPYLLVAQGREEKAMKNIHRLHGAEFDADGFMSSIRTDLDAVKTQETAGFMECFRGKNLLRTFIACSTFFVQANSGVAWVVSYMSYFMQLGGMSSSASFDTSVGLTGLMVVGNMFGWYLIERLGRRGTFLYGCIVLSATLFLIGILAVIDVDGAISAQVAFMAVWAFTYQATIGSAAWPIISEVPNSSLRSHTQSLATATNGLANSVWSFALPYAVNPDKGNMGGKIAFAFGGITAICCVGIYFYFPETKGRTFMEIDTLFEMGVSPRNFAKTKLATVSDDFLGKTDVMHEEHATPAVSSA